MAKEIENTQEVKVVNIVGRGWGSDAAISREEAEKVLARLGQWEFDEDDGSWKGRFNEDVSQKPLSNDGWWFWLVANQSGLKIGNIGLGGTLSVDMENLNLAFPPNRK